MPRGVPGSRAPHGQLVRYTRHGCRCEACKRAMREWSQRKYGHKPRYPLPPAIHGTESTYNNRGCRCDSCRQASSTARATRKRAA